MFRTSRKPFFSHCLHMLNEIELVSDHLWNRRNYDQDKGNLYNCDQSNRVRDVVQVTKNGWSQF